ncbi:MAG TPA: phosphotransferase [Candidatus Babeliales bacterium]|nr:phosphotransferase [Candidatus Babeliales bacterium]
MSLTQLAPYLELFKKKFPLEQIEKTVYMQGAEHHVIEINDKWICKIQKTSDSTTLEIEKKVLNLLKGKIKTKIPTVAYAAKGFIVYKKIAGIELTTNFYNCLGESEQNLLAADIAFFLYELHNGIELSEAQEIGLEQTNWPWSQQKIKEHAHLIGDQDLKEIFLIFIRNYQDIIVPLEQTKLIHNDLILRNIIVHPSTGRLSGIIDFTDAAIDSFYLDLRLNYMSIPKLSESIAEYYARLNNVPLIMENIYLYYIATEFSRYLQDHGKNSLAKARIIEGFNLLQKQ